MVKVDDDEANELASVYLQEQAINDMFSLQLYIQGRMETDHIQEMEDNSGIDIGSRELFPTLGAGVCFL